MSSVLFLLLAASASLGEPARLPPDEGDADAVPAEVSDPQAEAKVHFDAGAEAFAVGDFALALQHFKTADDLSPHPANRYHIARCHEELGHLLKAVQHYRALESSAGLSDRERATAVARRRLVEERLPTLVVHGPPGRPVEIDGSRACETPCEQKLDPGKYEVRVLLGSGASRHTVELTEAQEHAIDVAVTKDRMLGMDTRKPPARYPTALTWVGIPVGALGLAGTLGFGLRAQSLHDAHTTNPTADTRTRGQRMQALTNASIAIAGAGAVLIVVDAIRHGIHKRASSRRTMSRR